LTLNSKITRGSSGFTLIELLVVVAILGILAAIGIVSYNGYVDSSKKKSAENIMMQIGLAQTEYYSDTSQYYTTPGSSPTNCSPTSTTSTAIETNLLSGADLITDEIGFEVCIHPATAPTNYKIVGKQTTSSCIIRVDGNQTSSRENC
jgi:prepilin-type N-terminal cleavage/methylation domain-containing protein